MKQSLIIILIFFLTNSSILFGQEAKSSQNLKISIFSLLDNAKFQYERKLNQSSTCGITASFFYITPMCGVKLEPAFRYYFKKDAPTGWYIEPKLSIGYFQTGELFEKYSTKYNSSNEIIDWQDLDGGSIIVSFMPVGGSLKIGHQHFFGKKDQFILDYNLGFQYFPYKENVTKDEIIEYYDENGDRNEIVTIYEGSFAHGIVWYTIGAGSVIYSNLSIGYNF